jgi:hypothetical protein
MSTDNGRGPVLTPDDLRSVAEAAVVESEESLAKTEELLKRRDRALGSLLDLAQDDFAKRYRSLFQAALQGG